MNLGHLARKVLLIFQDDCVQRYQEALALHGSRMRYQPLPSSPPGFGALAFGPGGVGRGNFPVTHQRPGLPCTLCHGSSVGMRTEMLLVTAAEGLVEGH